jgi:hypothetical protein
VKVKTVLAWHFVKNDGTNRDGIKEQVGHWYKVAGEIMPCQHGLHGSVQLIDALNFAPGSILRRTEHQGTIVGGSDKLASSERRVLWQVDATKILHLFACWCAEDALKDAKIADERSWNAIKVKKLWVDGKATDDELDAARVAARVAAGVAAGDDARVAARLAAGVAAGDAARVAARLAAGVAAGVAARDAARARQNRKLTAMVMTAHRLAARRGRRHE